NRRRRSAAHHWRLPRVPFCRRLVRTCGRVDRLLVERLRSDLQTETRASRLPSEGAPWRRRENHVVSARSWVAPTEPFRLRSPARASFGGRAALSPFAIAQTARPRWAALPRGSSRSP